MRMQRPRPQVPQPHRLQLRPPQPQFDSSPSSSSSTSSGRSTTSATGCLRSAGPAACAHRSQRPILFPTRSQYRSIRGVTTCGIDGIAGSGSRASDQKSIGGIASRGPSRNSLRLQQLRSHRRLPSIASTAPTVSVSGQTIAGDGPHAQAHRGSHGRPAATNTHVTSFVEADMTSIEWRKRNKAAFEQAHGTKRTFTAAGLRSRCRKAIRGFSRRQCQCWIVTGIIIKKQINLRMATALPSR